MKPTMILTASNPVTAGMALIIGKQIRSIGYTPVVLDSTWSAQVIQPARRYRRGEPTKWRAERIRHRARS